MSREGISFLTKTLPRLCKAFDRALQDEVSLDCTGFRKIPGTQLPKFMGGLFQRVFTRDGRVLPTPCVASIAQIRQVLACYYKLKLPYEREQEQEVIDSFVKTDQELLDLSNRLSQLASDIASGTHVGRQLSADLPSWRTIANARKLITKLFSHFDPRNITPSHGPGSVSTRERLWEKWTFSNVSPRIASYYPIDEYFYTSLGHVSDDAKGLMALSSHESSARVCLVPKDSRGPRLISCEPLDFQWIQQGLSRAIVEHVESHPLTKDAIRFTDQRYNQRAALLGSSTGRYATLDLKEASDRISVGLVHLLFGGTPLLEALMNSRSLSTELPGGEIINLNKYAPMGSALCFPVLAVCVWAILMAGVPDAYAHIREKDTCIYVYGDDVIVPTAYAANAIERLEKFGLLVNRAKSCTKGFFRESCGVDAFRGVNVTPVRIRTVWSSSPCPHVYSSWIAYANSFYDRRYYAVYWWIVDNLVKVYGEIPDNALLPGGPSLREVPDQNRPRTRRVNKSLQRLEYKVWDIKPVVMRREIDGWKMLLRFFTEGQRPPSHEDDLVSRDRRSDPLSRPDEGLCPQGQAFSVRQYTKRKTIRLVKRWR